MSDSEGPAGVAHRFFQAIEQGDVEGVRSCYAEDAVIWHNYDELETNRTENVAMLSLLFTNTVRRRYEDRRLRVSDDGFIQQHRLVATRLDGVEMSLPACIICTVAQGRIQRLDEYFDSAQAAPFLATG